MFVFNKIVVIFLCLLSFLSPIRAQDPLKFLGKECFEYGSKIVYLQFNSPSGNETENIKSVSGTLVYPNGPNSYIRIPIYFVKRGFPLKDEFGHDVSLKEKYYGYNFESSLQSRETTILTRKQASFKASNFGVNYPKWFFLFPLVKNKTWTFNNSENKFFCKVDSVGGKFNMQSKSVDNCTWVTMKFFLKNVETEEGWYIYRLCLAPNLGIVKTTLRQPNTNQLLEDSSLVSVRYYPDAVTTENIKRIFKEIQVEEKAKFDAGQKVSSPPKKLDGFNK